MSIYHSRRRRIREATKFPYFYYNQPITLHNTHWGGGQSLKILSKHLFIIGATTIRFIMAIRRNILERLIIITLSIIYH